jgi:cytochrome bd-type quinol oxidase subunit 2
MIFTDIDAHDYATAKAKAEGNARLRSAVRIAMTIVIFIFLGLAYSFSYLAKGTAEYYVSIITLIMNILLFILVTGTTVVLRKRYSKYVQVMKEHAHKDEADAWDLGCHLKGK